MSYHRKQQKRKGKKNPSKKQGLSIGPPTIRMQPVFDRQLQCQVTTANCLNQVVTSVQLGKLLVGFMALTATTSGYFSNQFRIKKICLWSPCPAIGSLTMVSLKYSDSFNTGAGIAAPSIQVGDSSMEPDRPAKCCLRPPPGTAYSWYQTILSGNNFLVITCPIGSVLQFTYDHYLDNSGTISTGPTLIGATAGIIYNASITLSGGQLLVPHTSVNTISA
jgi:hypothetical protein